jgi:hypothetical protein
LIFFFKENHVGEFVKIVEAFQSIEFETEYPILSKTFDNFFLLEKFSSAEFHSVPDLRIESGKVINISIILQKPISRGYRFDDMNVTSPLGTSLAIP